jgi:tetratricopeptide (TPR) repeat protein
VGVLTRIASVMVIKGQLEQAEALLKQAQVANATYEPMYYYLGLLNENRKNFEEAMTNYRKALVLDPDDLEARYHFAVLQGQSKSNKEVQEAIKHLTYITGKYETQRRKESEMNSLVFLERGRLYFKIKLFKKALADFQQAISIDPTNIETLVAYGEVLITDNKLDEARIYLTEAIARNDKLYAAYFHLGKIHALQKQTRLAQKYFEIARSGDTSKYPEVHKMLGFMYRDLGLKPQAKGELKRYLAIAPAGYDTKEIQELLDKL